MSDDLIVDLIRTSDLTPAEAVDFVEAHLYGESQSTWADERGVTQQAVSSNINSAFETLQEAYYDGSYRGSSAMSRIREAINESVDVIVSDAIPISDRNQIAIEPLEESMYRLGEDVGITHPYGIFTFTSCNDEAPDDTQKQRKNEQKALKEMNKRFRASPFCGVQFDDVYLEKHSEGLPNEDDVIEFR